MEEHRVTLRYSGPELDRGVEPRVLAEAISGFADFADVLAKSFFEEATRPEARVEQVTRGSVVVEFLLLIQQGVALAAPFAADFNTLVQLMKSCIELIRFLKGRPPVSRASDGRGNISIQNVDGDVIVVSGDVANAVLVAGGSKFAERFIRRPLQKEADRLEVRSDGEKVFEVGRAEADNFVSVQSSADEHTFTAEIWLTLVAPVFEGEGKWRFNDGTRHVYASIEDQGFLDIVKSGDESFARGDQLLVRLRTTQERDGAKLTVRHAVEEVIQHVSRVELRTGNLFQEDSDV